jgi:MinD superfamily P-loop ATPase
MSSLNFIGGEKGGVGKSVMSRLLAQYLIDKQQAFMGFDTDRSHASFARFYPDHASSVVVDQFEGLDSIVGVFEEPPAEGEHQRVIVDLAAQTAAPLARWIKDSDVLVLLKEMGITVNFWHVTDAGKDSMDMLGRVLSTFGAGPNYIVVKNHGRGADFSHIDEAPALKKAISLNARVVELGQLHEASMRKIDAQNTDFQTAMSQKTGPDALGLLERQRVKTWLKTSYEFLDTLPI